MTSNGLHMNDSFVTTKFVIDSIARERARLAAAIERLGAEASTLPVTDEGWTAKDVLAHLIHYAEQIAFGLGAKLAPPAYVVGVSERLSGDQWNARAVAHYREKPFHAVREQFEGIVALLIERTGLRTDEQMNATDAMPWAGDRPLWQIIGGDTFLHWPLHAEAIERAAGI